MCRKSGLEQKRRCGWRGFTTEVGAPVIWGRKQVALSTCPKAYITAESTTLVDDFWARRRLGRLHIDELSGREADAFLILEDALACEVRDGQPV